MFMERRRQVLAEFLAQGRPLTHADAPSMGYTQRRHEGAKEASKNSRPHGQRGETATYAKPAIDVPYVPSVEMPRSISKTKAKPQAAPKTGTIHRRTSIIPASTELWRAELENLAAKWNVECHGKTVHQIQDELFELDAFLTEQARCRQG